MAPHRQLTQTGINRVLWLMLHALGGKFEVSNADITTVNQEVGIRIDHNSTTDKFTLSLQRLQEKQQSNIIILN